MKEVTVIELEKPNSYVLTTPGELVYLLDCNKNELQRAVTELENAKKEIVKNNTTDYMTSLAIIPTYNCNLRCIYCYANGGRENQSIDINTVKKVIDYKRKEKPNAKTLDLYLVGGGEPLLNFDLVKEIVKYADSQFEEVVVNVVTNGTGTKEVMDWLIDRKANIRVSFDSVNQAKQRPFSSGANSHDIVIDNIKYLISHDANVMVQCIITSNSVNKMQEIVKELEYNNVKVVKFEPCLMTDVSRGEKNLQPDPKLFAEKLVEIIEYVANNNIDLMIDSGYFSKPMDGYYCGMADGNFTITPENMITSCVEVSRKSEPYSDKVMIGKIENSVMLNNDNINFLKKLHYKNQCGGCCKCEFRFICLGGCPMANIWQNGLPLTKSQFTCIVEHIFLPKILTKMIENDKIINVMCEEPLISFE